MTMAKEQIDKLISITKEKSQLLNTMHKITKGQGSEIEKEDMENLNEIMDKKDRIIKEIDRLDISFLTIFSQIKKDHSIESIDELDMQKYPNLVELKDAVKEVSSTLMAISLIDEKNNKAMKQKLEQTKLELRRVKEGKKAYKGYNSTITGSILIDEKK